MLEKYVWKDRIVGGKFEKGIKLWFVNFLSRAGLEPGWAGLDQSWSQAGAGLGQSQTGPEPDQSRAGPEPDRAGPN